MEITIEPVSEVTPDVVAGLSRLLPQLSNSAPVLRKEDIEDIISRQGTTLFLARERDRRILGMVTLVYFRIPSGRRARIESLVVDHSARGRGIGRLLCQAALDQASHSGADSVDLTSSHSRGSANALYQRMGFQLRASNVYRCSLSSAPRDALPTTASQTDEHR
jgi:ribosomal protein S18 acetylase RimI-like enzyme